MSVIRNIKSKVNMLRATIHLKQRSFVYYVILHYYIILYYNTI